MSLRHRAARLVRAAVRSRLVQFAAIGSVIFAIAPASRAPGRDVHVSAPQLAALRSERARRLGVRALTEDDVQRVEQRAIEDELLVREAQRLGLDDGDAIVRQRLVQKMLFLVEEMAGASRVPTEEEIAAYYTETADRWTRAPRVSFVHVVAPTSEIAASLRPRVVAWSAASAPGAVPPFGDALPVSRSVSARVADVAQTFGASFGEALRRLAVGEWSAPIASRLGFHLVRVSASEPARRAELAEVHDEVRAALVEERRRRAVDAWMRASLARYRVDVDGRAVVALSPSDRAAARGSASGED
jgi:hypothetical protein